MSMRRTILAVGLAASAFVGVIGGFAAPAQADWRYDRWRNDRWRAHEYRMHDWRAHRWGTRYYYGRRIYIAPPIVYGPPPPSPGIGLLFNFR